MKLIARLFGLFEQLSRIEHKLDLVLESQALEHPMTPLRPFGDATHLDPLTMQPVTYRVDPVTGVLVREGSHRLGLSPPMDVSSPTAVAVSSAWQRHSHSPLSEEDDT